MVKVNCGDCLERYYDDDVTYCGDCRVHTCYLCGEHDCDEYELPSPKPVVDDDKHYGYDAGGFRVDCDGDTIMVC